MARAEVWRQRTAYRYTSRWRLLVDLIKRLRLSDYERGYGLLRALEARASGVPPCTWHAASITCMTCSAD